MPTKPGSELERIFESFEKEKIDETKQLKEPDNIDYLLKGKDLRKSYLIYDVIRDFASC